ncbi:MAG: hypothetical protein ACREFX_07955 [Opitutaceae bacterium]
MELLDRYLEAIRKHLPWRRQDDILAELRANLVSQLEEREAELGRPLTPSESEDWLRDLGSPVQMAARYQSQQYLIGPQFFPIYLAVMRTALLWLGAVYICIWTISALTTAHAVKPALDIAYFLPLSLFLTAAVITVGFALTEFLSLHFPGRFARRAPKGDAWSPAGLLPVPTSAQRAGPPRTRAGAIAGLALCVIFLAWWLLVPSYPYALLGPDAALWLGSPIECAPILIFFYWWIAATTALQACWRAIDLARGAWAGRNRLEQRVISLFGLIPTILMVSARGHAYLRLRQPAPHGFDPATLAGLNSFIHFFSCLVLAVLLLHLAWDCTQSSLRYYRRHAPAHA